MFLLLVCSNLGHTQLLSFAKFRKIWDNQIVGLKRVDNGVEKCLFCSWMVLIKVNHITFCNKELWELNFHVLGPKCVKIYPNISCSRKIMYTDTKLYV